MNITRFAASRGFGTFNLARPLRIVRVDAGESGHHAVRASSDHRFEQALLRSEVAVDGHLRNARVRGDRVQARPLEAVRMEVRPRRFEDAPRTLGDRGAGHAPAWAFFRLANHRLIYCT